MLADFKQKLKGQPSRKLSALLFGLLSDLPQDIVSSTPPGSPPPAMLSHLGLMNGSQNARPQQPAATSQPDAASILAALAGMNNNNNSKPAVLPPPPPPPQAPAPTQDLSALLANISRQAPPPAATPQNFALPPAPPQFGGAFPPPQPNQLSLPPQLQGMFPPPPQQAPPPQFQPPPPAANPIAALSSLLPPHILGNPQALTQVLTLFQDLAKAGIPQEQWGPVITALYPAQPAPTAAPAWQPPQQNENGNRNGGFDSFGAYNNQGGRRDRSRSPDFGHNRNVPGRRPSPVYGTYDAAAASGADGYQDDGGRGRGKGGRQYRQRTPPRNGGLDNLIPGSIAPKWTDIDPTIAPGSIKVLSRTLFVGGATGTESEIRAIFSRFGRVQTCIVNNDKRHAFVKMATRQDAVNARAGMENQRDPDILSKARQTKWGVGFGPRECCDYTTGVSIIPIDSLTEADHKWVLTAEYGGTGGRPVESGLVMEEPDIEIGAGVSSKAMSRRVMPDTSGGKRGRGGRGGDHGGGGGRFRQPEPRYESPRPETQSVQPPPPVPNFGFQFAMPGMPPYQ